MYDAEQGALLQTMQLEPQMPAPRSFALRLRGQAFLGSGDAWDGTWKHTTLVTPQPTGCACRALESAHAPALSSDGRWLAWADHAGLVRVESLSSGCTCFQYEAASAHPELKPPPWQTLFVALAWQPGQLSLLVSSCIAGDEAVGADTVTQLFF